MSRLPVRFKLRTMMVVVAIVRLACLGGRELWRRWLRPEYRNPVSQSHLSARARNWQPLAWHADQPIPVRAPVPHVRRALRRRRAAK